MLNNQEALNRVFRALADPTRRAIVERLARGEVPVSTLAEPLDMTLAGVVQHIQVLEESGLIRTRKVGRVRTCQMAPEALSGAESWIADRRALWEKRFDLLGDVLAKHRKGTQDRSNK